MITQYTFDVATAKLVEETGFGDKLVTHHWRLYFPEARELTGMTVSEGVDAEREFFNHFSGTKPWPPGWYVRIIGDLITRKAMM